MPSFDPEYSQKIIDAVKEYGSQKKAAIALGMAQSNVSGILKTAAKHGMLPYDPVMPGFEVSHVRETTDSKGNIRSRSIVQIQERGEEFKVPDGHAIKGVSALLDADGRKIQSWVKTYREPLSFERMSELAEKAFTDFKPSAPAIIVPDSDSERIACYPWADWHMGLLAWSKETDSVDWDLSIAKKTIIGAFKETVEQMPKANNALVLGLGDIFHIDNHKSVTPASGNLLDTDSRYAKIFEVTIETLVECAEIARSHHATIEMHFKEGNHDPATTVGLRQVIRMYYRNAITVQVGNSPSPFFVKRFGNNLIGAVHGDKAKREQLPIIMASRWPKDWADTTTRHWHTGHIHHDTLKEIDGVSVYSHRAPVAQDAWHAAQGYLSGRSMKGFVYHTDRGFRSMVEIGIS